MADLQISVNFEVLGATAQQLRQQADTLQQQLTSLQQALGPMRETWSGQVNAQYTEYWRQISTGMQRLYDDVNLLGMKANTARELQEANERSLAAKFGG